MPNEHARLTTLLDVLSTLGTEASTTERGDLDLLDTIELVDRMNAEDRRVPVAVAERSAEIAAAVDGITARFRDGDA